MSTQGRIIVALDGIPAGEIIGVAKQFAQWPEVVFKVNDALDDPGPIILKGLLEYGNTFADAKYDDIPKTMTNRVKNIARHHPGFITVHATNSSDAIEAAVAARGYANILAVTVLTSINAAECKRLYGTASIEKVVLNLALHAADAGVQGIVCSAAELKFLNKFRALDGLIRVTPAIRPLWYQKKMAKGDDQDPKRTMTPSEAFGLGADLVVMGRPLLNSPGMSSEQAMEATMNEIDGKSK